MQRHAKNRNTKPERMKPNTAPKPKVVKRNYHVSEITAYNVRRLAMESNMSEGRIIDKIVRNYMADREFPISGH